MKKKNKFFQEGQTFGVTGRGRLKKGKGWGWLIAIGALCGAANGAFGGGGGLLVVPALERFSSLSAKQAHATAILVILPVTFFSAILYLFAIPVDFSLLVPCALGVSVGGAVGAGALKKFNSALLTFLFSLVMFFAGIKMLFF